MKILITGADGLLGSNLVRELLGGKHTVSALLYPNARSKTLDGLDIQKYYGDITKPDTLDDAFKNNDVVIHVAANTSIWPSRSGNVRQVNIEGTQNIIVKTLQYQLKKIIYIGSASSVNTKDNGKSKYKYPGAKYKLDYIDSKYEALQLINKSIKDQNLPATVILPTFMIGPYDSGPSSGKMILNVASGKLKFYTGGGRNFVHVQDVVSAIVKSINSETNGIQFIIGNENLTYYDFFRQVSQVVGCVNPKIKIPDWTVKTVGLFGSASGTVFRKEPLLSYPMAKISCEKQFVQSDSGKELNIQSIPVKKAIEDAYNWFKENNYI